MGKGCYAVVMAGGAGTRFWPLSRRSRPKQMLPLIGKKTMIRETVDRLYPLFKPDDIYVITNIEQGSAIRRELPDIPPDNVVDEPMGRDTAPCVGLAATIVEVRERGAAFCALPADHFIKNTRKFQSLLKKALRWAEKGEVVTFGVKPSHPSTGFGYLKRGERLSSGAGGTEYALDRFCEKPDIKKARQFLKSGMYYWNSGIFAFRSDTILKEIRRFMPDLSAGLDRIKSYWGTGEQGKILHEEYARFRKISIDYGVMERLDRAVIIEADFGWDDVGGWEAAAAMRRRDGDGNAIEAIHCGVETKDCIFFASEGHLLATVGLKGMLIVHTPDATIVCPRDRADEMKKLVKLLEEKKLARYL